MSNNLVPVDCPFCEERTNAERNKNWFADMGFFTLLFHTIMTLITTAFWVGVLITLYILKEKTNKCLKCKQKVDDEYLVVNDVNYLAEGGPPGSTITGSGNTLDGSSSRAAVENSTVSLTPTSGELNDGTPPNGDSHFSIITVSFDLNSNDTTLKL